MAEDTWFRWDLPVLDAVVTYMDDHPGMLPQLTDIAGVTGLDIEEVGKAARRMDGSYLDLRTSTGPTGHWHIRTVSPQARIETGQWPSPETMASRILTALEEQAERQSDEEQRTWLRQAIHVLGSVTQDAATNVLTAAVLRASGMP